MKFIEYTILGCLPHQYSHLGKKLIQPLNPQEKTTSDRHLYIYMDFLIFFYSGRTDRYIDFDIYIYIDILNNVINYQTWGRINFNTYLILMS